MGAVYGAHRLGGEGGGGRAWCGYIDINSNMYIYIDIDIDIDRYR